MIQLLLDGNPRALARAISLVENDDPSAFEIIRSIYPRLRNVPILGVTGPAGVGKSSLVDQLIAHYRAQGLKLGIVAVDPTSPFSGGAILGDRIRMQRHGTDPDVFIRSMATRGKLGGVAAATFDVIDLMNANGKDMVILETVGVGQDEVDVVKIAHTTIVVLMPGLGDEVQAMKAGLMEIADLLVINKSDRPETDKMESELQAILSFIHPAEDQWMPKIIRTVATSNSGIDVLAEAVEEHQQFLSKSGKLSSKLLHQSRQRLIDALEYQVTTTIMEKGFERFHISEKIDEIAARKTDPYTVVRDLLSHFKLE